MYNLICKVRNKVLLIIILILMIIIYFFSANPKQMNYVDYNGLDASMVEKLNIGETNGQCEDVLNEIENQNILKAKNGDNISQTFSLNTVYLDSLGLKIRSNGNATLKIKLTDENNKEVYSDNIDVTNTYTNKDLNINSEKYDRKTNFLLTIDVDTKNPQTNVEIYTIKEETNNLVINNKIYEYGNILIKSEGRRNVYKQKTISLLILSVIIAIAILLTSIYSKKEKFYNMINTKLLFIKRKIWYLVSEWIAYLALLYVFLQFFSSFIYKEQINFVYMTLFIILFGIFIFFIGVLIINFKEDIAFIFLLIAIPVGLTFMLFILPEQVPDENVHFGKAYLTSQFNFTSAGEFMITNKFNTFSITNYNDILPKVFDLDNYSSMKVSHDISNYNFILYIGPALAILITRTLHLSVYFSFYAGRMVNLAIFLFFIYQAIKITPKAKWIFFIYCFNPMLLQQGMSYSADCMINSVCIFAVAYFFKLYYSDDLIQNKDIFIVFSMIGFILITKYVYLPIFGIYFLIINKLFKINYKQVILCIICIISIGIFYYISLKLNENQVQLAAHTEYLKAMQVDQRKQIEFLTKYPKNIYYMLRDTLQYYGDFYVESFTGKLGWLEIRVNDISVYMYYILLIGMMLFRGVNKIGILKRLWMILVAIVVMILVILGLYLQWTTVGVFIAQGVQGRYFLPCILIVSLALSYNRETASSYKYIDYAFIFCLCVMEGLVFIDIAQYFM